MPGVTDGGAWKGWKAPAVEVTALLIAADDELLTQTVPGIADHINRMASAAATMLMALCVIVGIGHSFGDLANWTLVTAEGYQAIIGPSAVASRLPWTSTLLVSPSLATCAKWTHPSVSALPLKLRCQ